MLLLAPMRPDDSEVAIKQKMRLVARFVDILITRRIWNFRSIAYSTMQYAMFLVMRNIRGLDTQSLAKKLYSTLLEEKETFHSNERLRVHRQNRYALHRVLARMTDYVETQSGQKSRYLEYIATGRNRYEVEHIWADHPERHKDEFPHDADFEEHRNRIGGLLLLPKAFNASYGDLTYGRRSYRTIKPRTYWHDHCIRKPTSTTLGFSSSCVRVDSHCMLTSNSSDLILRVVASYTGQLAERIWNPDDLLRETAD